MSELLNLLDQFETSVKQLQQLLSGGEADSVVIDGQLLPSIAKAIHDNFLQLQAITQGRLVFETKAALDASGAPAEDVLAEVWKDPVKSNNGLYGYSNDTWEKSPYDVNQALLEALSDLLQLFMERTAGLVPGSGVAGDIIPLVVDQDGNIALGLKSDSGELVADLGLGEKFGLYESQTPASGMIPLIEDSSGAVAVGLSESGELLATPARHTAAAGAEKLGIFEEGAFDCAFAVCDEAGKVAFKVTEDGRVISYDPSSLVESPLSDVNHILIRGQSLSQGYNSNPPVSTGEQAFGALCFDGLVRPETHEEFLPLVEVTAGIYGESPAAGLAAQAKQSVVGPYGADELLSSSPHFLASIHSTAGTDIDGLNKGSNSYDSVQAAVSAAAGISEKSFMSYGVAGMFWIQGEKDEQLRTDRNTYKNLLIGLKNDHLADIRAALNRPALRFPFIMYQTGYRYTHDTPIAALAQLDAAESDRDIYMATPVYYLPVSDHVHLQPHSSRWLGEQLGKVWRRVFIDGDAWRPLSPDFVGKLDAQTVRVEFHVPHPPLRLDTQLVTDPGDYGFELVDDSGDVPLSSVRLSGSCEVIIEASRPLAGNPLLRYAYSSYGGNAGPETGARGNLRDSDPAVSAYTDAGGDHYPLFNWCVTFEKTIEE